MCRLTEKYEVSIIECGYLQSPYVEAEMLYGIRPEFCKQLKDDGLPVRIYLT